MGADRAIEPIDLDVAVEDAVPSRRRPWMLVLVAVFGPLAVLAASVVLAADGDVEVAVEEDEDQQASTTTASPERREVPDARSFPAPLALGGPTDGTESIGLPVKAEPATGLVDGQAVTVTGTGFPPNVTVGVVMCTKEAGRDHGARGVAACNIGHVAQAESDDQGVATATFTVRRLVLLDGVEVDCASEAQRCLIGMGMISDYDTSGGVLVDFDATAPLPDPPTATVEPASGLTDGQEVTVSVTGLVPGSPVGAMVCSAQDESCVDASAESTADTTGAASFSVRVWQVFGVPVWEPGRTARNVDCAAEPCHLQVWGEAPAGRALPVLDLSFAGGPVDRSAPALVVPSTGPFRPGDEIVVELPELDHGIGVEPLICSDQGCSGSMTQQAELLEGRGQRVRLLVPSAEQGNTCIDRPCTLVVHVYAPMGGAQPPALFPDPVPVTIVP